MIINFVTAIILFAPASHTATQYRSDYEYNRKANAFYKLHTEYMNYEDAKAICETEGASLMNLTPSDIVQAHGMMKQFPDVAKNAWVGDDGLSHASEESSPKFDYYDGNSKEASMPLCEAVTLGGEVEKFNCQKHSSFICKVNAKDAFYDATCKVTGRGYQYQESVGSCYMISSAAYSWNMAYDECRAQGAHLLILNSELEHGVVHNLTHFAPKISSKATSPWYWYAGVRAQKTTDGTPVEYKTIFGQSLAEAGYDQWSVGEPNNLYGNELCGSIFTNDGKYNDLNCSHLFAFICEKEVNSTNQRNKSIIENTLYLCCVSLKPACNGSGCPLIEN